MKNEIQKRVIDWCAMYVAPISALVAVVAVMLLNAILWGGKYGWSVGILVMCGEVLALAYTIKFISEHTDENDENATIK